MSSNKKRQQTLFELGLKKKGKTANGDRDSTSTHTENELNSGSSNLEQTETNVIEADESTSLSDLNQVDEFQIPISIYDIANYTNKILSNEEKYLILNNLAVPEDGYQFPSTKFGQKNRSFQAKYLSDFGWLAYSKSQDAAYCKYCFAFGSSNVGKGSHQAPGVLAKYGFKKWNDAITKFKSHQANSYHHDAVVFSENFSSIYSNQTPSISEKIQTHRAKEIIQNRTILSKIFNSIIFLGRQNIPLRGHEDHGRISLSNPENNDGNFRSLLRLLAQMGDKELENHLRNAPKNAWYTSSNIQNEIIEICGDLLQERIVRNVNNAQCFSVLADETTEISNKEQLSICVRYVFESTLHEEFLTFVAVTDLTGEGLAESILTNLSALGIEISNLRGQSYDGAAAMSGRFKGVQARILETFPKAIYTYCGNHCLNLVISDACSQQNIRNMIGTIKEISNFFNRSALRQAHLNRFIKESDRNDKFEGLISLCETRWIERHESIVRFVKLFPIVLEVLEHIESTSNDSDSRTKSYTLQKAMSSFEFIVSLHCASKLLSLSLPLSRSLQSKTADLQLCYEQVTELSAILQSLRSNSTAEFNQIFVKAREIASDLDIEIKTPRRCGRQNYRGASQSADPETYYRETIFLPFLGDFIGSILTRFENHTSNLCPLLNLLPRYIKDSTLEEIHQIFEFYKGDITTDLQILEGEYIGWKHKWSTKKLECFPQTVLDALAKCDASLYPNINRLLKILCTMPISTADVERTFSTLQRLKTYLRSTMSQQRLRGLALLNIYNGQDLNIQELIDKFKKKNRNILL